MIACTRVFVCLCFGIRFCWSTLVFLDLEESEVPDEMWWLTAGDLVLFKKYPMKKLKLRNYYLAKRLQRIIDHPEKVRRWPAMLLTSMRALHHF